MNTGRAGPPHLPPEQHGLRPRRITGAQLLVLRLHHRRQMETQGASRFERVQRPLRPERFAGVWGAARPTGLKSAMILSSAAFRMVAFARRSTLWILPLVTGVSVDWRGTAAARKDRACLLPLP